VSYAQCKRQLVSLSECFTENLINSRSFREFSEFMTNRLDFLKRATSCRGLEAILVDMHRADLRLQSRWRNSELGCRTRRSRNPAPRFSQSGANYFSILQRRPPESRLCYWFGVKVFAREPTLLDREFPLVMNNYRSFDNILQLTDVSGPRISSQRLHRLERNRVNCLVHALAKLLDEVPHQQRNVFRAFAQCGNRNRKHVQSVVKVAA